MYVAVCGGDVLYVECGGDVLYVECGGDVLYVECGGDVLYVECGVMFMGLIVCGGLLGNGGALLVDGWGVSISLLELDSLPSQFNFKNSYKYQEFDQI